MEHGVKCVMYAVNCGEYIEVRCWQRAWCSSYVVNT